MTPNNRVFPPQEFRVTLTDRLVNVAVVPATIPLPALPKTKPDSIPNGLKELPPESRGQDTSLTEIGRQLTADRQLIAVTLDNLRTSLAEMSQQQTERVEQWRTAAVEMATAITAKLLHRKIQDGEFPIENMIRDMSRQLSEEPVVRVRLNPKDLELLEQRLNGEPLMTHGDDPQLIADNTLGRTECRVEGSQSVLFANLTEQLRQVREDLLRSLHDARS